MGQTAKGEGGREGGKEIPQVCSAATVAWPTILTPILTVSNNIRKCKYKENYTHNHGQL